MTSSWLDWAIILFIICAIGWIIWKGGAANPETTGALSKQIGEVSQQQAAMRTRLRHIEAEVEEVKREAATTKDIERLEERIEGQSQLLQRTDRNVERIVQLLIEKGLGR